MAGAGDVIRAVTKLLEDTFQLTVVDKDVDENVPRPCFIIDVDNMKKDYLGLLEHISFNIHIYYIAPELYAGYANLFDVAVSIQNALRHPIFLDDTFCITIEEQSIDISRVDMGIEIVGLVELVNPYDDSIESNNNNNNEDMFEIDVRIEKEG